MIDAFWFDSLFILCAIFSILLFLLVVTVKNPVYSILFLIGGFIPIAVIYFMLNAYFIGIIQILVYAGAIMVLFAFVIMMIDLSKDDYKKDKPLVYRVFAGIAIFIALLIVTIPVIDFTSGLFNHLNSNSSNFGTIESIGKMIFSPFKENYFLLSFELVSMLILLGIVGVIILAKQRQAKEED